ncbi:MAG TPA: hypothetical protein EYQ63_20595 [Fuerstia sp.]|nr:hypothetical protein [Fuerstiella sp.]
MVSFLSKGVQGVNRVIRQRSNNRVFFDERQRQLLLRSWPFQEIANALQPSRTVAHGGAARYFTIRLVARIDW